MVTEPNLLNKYIEQLIREPSNPVFLAAVLKAKAEVISNITLKCQTQPNSFRRKRYIRLQLCRLVRTADTLYREVRYQQHNSLKKALVTMLQVIDEINALLPECDPKVMLPKVALDRARKQYRLHAQSLREKLESHHIKIELIELSLLPLLEFLDSNLCERFSKRQFCYLQKHVKGINSLVFNTLQPETAGDLLLDRLISLNYNNIELFYYSVNQLLQKICNCTDYSERERMLKAYRKRWRALPGSSSGYDSRLKSVRDSLLKWLNEELKSLKK